jgi:hypothetical protein
MNGRSVARVVLALVIVAGVAFLGVGAYNAGVSQGLAQSGQVVVTPGTYPVGPYIGGWGYGWGHGIGFGFFGFLGTLFFIFLFIGLLRAAFGGSRRGWGGRGGWGGPGGPGRYDHWQNRVREVHDELHRTADDGRTGGSRAATDRGPDGEPPA